MEDYDLMVKLGLPTAFSTSKRPFYTDDESTQDDDDTDEHIEESKLAINCAIKEGKKSKKNNNKRRRKVKSKYWNQRYRLFSLFDKGISLDQESWYSVTPEEIAIHIAQRCVQNNPLIIFDPFCGVGGNSIQFALASKSVFVIASDICPSKIAMAKHNAEIYQAQDRILFICDDFNSIIHRMKCKVDVVFLSPPWGGPNYLNQDKYSLTMMDLDGINVYKMARKYLTPNIAYFLPRNIDRDELNGLLEPDESVEIENNRINDKVKTITAYFGNLIDVDAQKEFADSSSS